MINLITVVLGECRTKYILNVVSDLCYSRTFVVSDNRRVGPMSCRTIVLSDNCRVGPLSVGHLSVGPLSVGPLSVGQLSVGPLSVYRHRKFV